MKTGSVGVFDGGDLGHNRLPLQRILSLLQNSGIVLWMRQSRLSLKERRGES